LKELRIAAAIRTAIEDHAAECYPDECCGVIVAAPHGEEARRITNVQNERHARDPQQFPRNARIAYTMGPEIAPILIDAERGRIRLRAFYHSHPEHEAYFSEEDRAAALAGWDEPSYPNTAQIVMSVREGAVRYAKAFAWDATLRDFVEIPLVIE